MKRRLFKFALFLLLGAVTTIATSWYFAAGPSKDGFRVKPYERGRSEIAPNREEIWVVYRTERLGLILIRSIWSEYTKHESFPGKIVPAEQLLPSWASDLVPVVPDEGIARGGIFVEGTGWPAIAMRWRVDLNWLEVPPPQVLLAVIGEVSEGILLTHDIPVRQVYAYERGKVLPLRPTWPGFAINTLFYAGILWLLTLGPFTARRMIRRKRGRCIKCGYDLRETSGGCPECGWGRIKTGG